MNEHQLIDLAIKIGIYVGVVVIIALLFFTTKYRVSPKRVTITVLGIPVRWISIQNIKHMSTDTRFWAERWYNTLNFANRRVAIRTRSGILCRTIIITPADPHQFMHEVRIMKRGQKSDSTSDTSFSQANA